MIVKARFVVPVDGPPIENGTVHFEGGHIVAVGPASQFAVRGVIEYGDAVILPGFVNAHTHLELSLLAGRVPPSSDFVDWLRRLIAARTEDLQSADDAAEYFVRAVRVGITESVSSGVTTVGDITASPRITRPVLADSPIRALSFGEVIAMGKGRDLLPMRLNAAADFEHQSERLRVGVSPHAPYSVEPAGLRECGQRARVADMPLCVHMAETADEERFIRSGEGPFAEFLADLGLWDENIAHSDCTPVELLGATGVLGSQTLLAHANYVSDHDIELIAAAGASVVYCPRTHAAFGHPPHRVRDMLRAGVNVCLGTDSLASNPSLSILDELRFLHSEWHDVAPDDLLAMGTIRGARALGFGDSVGSLAPGKSADLAVIPLPPSAMDWHEILSSPQSPVAVYVGGRCPD
jgi:aminodeoxyfutalosine deaminase